MANNSNHGGPRIVVIYENGEWVTPLAEAIRKEAPDVDVQLFSVAQGGAFAMGQEPPMGVFFNKLSASSGSRGHVMANEYARSVLAWLALHKRTVINGQAALELELSKSRQLAALQAGGVSVPATHVVCGQADTVVEVARMAFVAEDGACTPYVVKPNRGGKGVGVARPGSLEDLRKHVESLPAWALPDQTVLLQEYIKPADGYITRAEFVGGKLMYAMRVKVDEGSFELCPADACNNSRFEIVPREDIDEFAVSLVDFVRDMELDVCGIEYVTGIDGRSYVIDINVSTNYNTAAEHKAFGGHDRGMPVLARFLIERARAEAEGGHLSRKQRKLMRRQEIAAELQDVSLGGYVTSQCVLQ